MKVGDLVYNHAGKYFGIIVDNLGPEDVWEILCEDGNISETGDWELEVVNENR